MKFFNKFIFSLFAFSSSLCCFASEPKNAPLAVLVEPKSDVYQLIKPIDLQLQYVESDLSEVVPVVESNNSESELQFVAPVVFVKRNLETK